MPDEFRDEAELKRVLAEWYRCRGFVVATEVSPGPSGIADVVAFRLVERHLRKRLAAGQSDAMASRAQITVFLNLPDAGSGWISEDELSEMAGFSVPYLRRQLLPTLEQGGFVVRRERRLCRVNGWYPLAGATIAIEAKLHDVSRAIEQAIAYRYFADEVYMALPSSAAYRARRRRDLKGVGIIAAKPDSAWCIKRSPRAEPLSQACSGLAGEVAWLASRHGGLLEGVHECPTQFPLADASSRRSS